MSQEPAPPGAAIPQMLSSLRQSWTTAWDVRALRKRVSALANARVEVLADMGRTVFALHEKGKIRNADLVRDCQRVTQINDQIAELNRQIEAALAPRSTGEMPPVTLGDETEVEEEAEGSAAAQEPPPAEESAAPEEPAEPVEPAGE